MSNLVIVFVVDGLRPDAITPDDTPMLFRLRSEGVDFTNGHAVVPTVTRVNAATLATGTQPGTHGILGNQLYVPSVDARRALDTGDHRKLRALDRVVLTTTLAERLHAHGKRLAGVSSGSTGSGFLLAPSAPSGVGVVVNGYFDPGTTVAYPLDVSAAILAKLGPAPPKTRGERFDAVVAWTQRALREYVLPEIQPDVVINWLTEPDHTQHTIGVGSLEAREAIRNADREVAHALAVVDPTATDVVVVSDHGFTTNTAGVDVTRALIDAGLKASTDSTDVVVASSGQAVALHVEHRDAERIARIARFVRSCEWGGVIFTGGRNRDDVHGTVEGTFALELVHAANAVRGADLLITFPWTSDTSAFGVRGTDLANVSGGAAPYHSDHGSMSPWNVRNTFFAWGASFKTGATVRTPAGTADVAPTILALLGIADREGLDGRVLGEALAGGPDENADVVDTRVHTVDSEGYRAAIQVSTVDGRRYVDASWRVA